METNKQNTIDDTKIKLINFLTRRKIQRFAIKVIRNFSIDNKADQSTSTSEKEVISVCRRLLNECDSELSMTPITLRREIMNKRLNIKVMIKNTSVIVYQNKTSYPTLLSDKGYRYLITIFNNKKENDMNIEEAEINNEVKNSIKTIFNYIVKNHIDNEKK